MRRYTEALNNLNTLSDTDRNATRTLLLENLDTISQEKLDEAKKQAKIQAQQAKKVQEKLFADPATLLLPQHLLPPSIKSAKTIIPPAPYFNGLRAFDAQMKKLETKTDNLVSRIRTTDISFKDLCGEIGENLRGFEGELKAVKAEPENLFMDFCYFFSGIPKPPSLYELNQEFLTTSKITAIASAFKGVSESTPGSRKVKLDHLGGILGTQIQRALDTLEQLFPRNSDRLSPAPLGQNPFVCPNTCAKQKTEPENEGPGPKGPGL